MAHDVGATREEVHGGIDERAESFHEMHRAAGERVRVRVGTL